MTRINGPTIHAMQKSAVKWLLSKSYNKVPENIREPFYRDHEDQEHLKPQIIHKLANAELYCLALANIYSDPNYHNLNHWGIIQALVRKGVYMSEPSDTQLTETVLIQTTPLKMSAHMAVIQAMMVLYAKEVVTPDRVVAAIQRFSHFTPEPLPADHEEALLLWVNQACRALKLKIEQEIAPSGEGGSHCAPELPVVREFKGLCDGVALAALISFYCPEELPWTDIIVGYLPTISDSIHNVLLVHNFCNNCLPSSVFHMMPEDVTYMRGSMQQSLVVFLADIFNVLEIHPVKCVKFHGNDRGSLKDGTSKPSSVPTSLAPRKPHHNDEEQFVVHRGRAVPTLSSVTPSEEPLVPARLHPAKEKHNQDTKADERGEPAAAGRPSHWEDSRRSSYAGRRSRRNSVTEDSQLTIENFGGSQENLHLLARNPDKEVAVHVGRRTSLPDSAVSPAHTCAQDAQGLGVKLHFHDDASEKQDEEKSIALNQVKHSLDIHGIDLDLGNKVASSFVKMSQLNQDPTVHMKSDEDSSSLGDILNKGSILNRKSSVTSNGSTEKKATFAALPNNTTTWQQQSSSSHQQLTSDLSESTSDNSHLMASQLLNIRMKLEDKRRRIEGEKRRIEVVMNKQRQKVGKAAFLQAVTKGKGVHVLTAEAEMNKDASGDLVDNVSKLQGTYLFQDNNEESSAVEKKWLDHGAVYFEDQKTPEIDNVDLEEYHQSIFQMNTSLQDIQTDIQRLASQQYQIQDLTSQQQQMQSIVNQQQQQYHGLATQHHHQIQSLATQQQQIQSLVFQQQQLQSLAAQTYAVRNQAPDSAGQFYLHEDPGSLEQRTLTQPQSYVNPPHDVHTVWPNKRPTPFGQQENFSRPESKHSGFDGEAKHQNGGDQLDQQHDHHSLGTVNTTVYNSGFQLHPTTPPRHNQHDTLADKTKNTGFSHAPMPTPPVDDMEPQSISFIGVPSSNSKDVSPNLAHNIKGLQISSGSRTYRIPSPTRPSIGRNAFQQHVAPVEHSAVIPKSADIKEDYQAEDYTTEKGFYISLDNETQPKRPKPPLRTKRLSPKKDKGISQFESCFNDDDVTAPLQYDTYDSQDLHGFNVRPESRSGPRHFEDVLDSHANPRNESRIFNTRQECNDIKDQQEPRNFSDRQRSKDLFSRRDSQSPNVWQESREIADATKIAGNKLERVGISQTSLNTSLHRPRTAATLAEPDPPSSGVGLVIGNELLHPEPSTVDEMEKKKERIMLLSLQRRQQQEVMKQIKEQEAQRRRELDKFKVEERERKKEEERQRRQVILEQYKLKKAMEEAEREGKVLPSKSDMTVKPVPKMRSKSSASSRPRPKTIHIDSGNLNTTEGGLSPSQSRKGSTSNLADPVFNSHPRRNYYHGSHDNLTEYVDDRRSIQSSLFTDSPDDGRGTSPSRGSNQLRRRGSYKNSRDTSDPRRISGRPKYPSYQGTSNFRGRKSNSLMNLSGSSTDADSLFYRYGDTDSGLGRATPPRRAPSPGMSSMRHLPSPSGPGSLPPGLVTKRRTFDDGASDISSNLSSMMEYTGPRLYKQPATKSNRGIMLNAVEYCVFPGVVNREAKRRVLEEISRSESKHFLILFRDAGCQFRALYSYCPDREEVAKLYGTGPKQVNDRMFDKFFKYNSGGKCFSQIHTKSLTVTIDAFTIHNSLWQGKKVSLPNKKDMVLVI